jgi:hypothetical protein
MKCPSASGLPEAAGVEAQSESCHGVKRDLDPFETLGLLTTFTKTEEEIDYCSPRLGGQYVPIR